MISRTRCHVSRRALTISLGLLAMSCIVTPRAAAATTDDRLSITHYQQQTVYGCGPTSMQVVVKYKRGILNSQCTYWRAALGIPQSAACPNGATAGNRLYIEQVQSGLSDYVAYHGTVSSAGLTWTPLNSNIQAKSPIISLVALIAGSHAPSSSAGFHFVTVFGYHEGAGGKRFVWVSNSDAVPKTGALGTNATYRKVEIHNFRGERYDEVNSDMVDWYNLVGIHN